MHLIRLVPCFALFAFASCSLATDDSWLTDFEQAKTTAKKENRYLLLDFTGSDWCPPCIVLNRAVFSTPEFKDYASKNLVLMEVDFPKRKEQSKEVAIQNERLAQQYGIEGFPTVIVLNPDGKRVGELGYHPRYEENGAARFIADLEKLKKS